jgi:hypothetical protein
MFSRDRTLAQSGRLSLDVGETPAVVAIAIRRASL